MKGGMGIALAAVLRGLDPVSFALLSNPQDAVRILGDHLEMYLGSFLRF